MTTDRPQPLDHDDLVGNREPLYFDSLGHMLFGWLHRPSNSMPPPVLGLVICKPFGYEAVCAHRSLRAFADAAARIGVPALRFDYVGTGDSTDIDPEANQIEAWTRDIISAVDALQRLTGVYSVCLVGFRLGSLLAAIAAKDCKNVVALGFIGPVLSGARYLKELKMVRLASSLSTAQSASANGSPLDATDGDAGMEVSGFPVSPRTIAALPAIDVTSLPWSDGMPLLVVDGNSLSTARAWTVELQARGVKAEFRVLPGIIEMLMTEPHFAQTPSEIVATFEVWLEHLKQRYGATKAGTAGDGKSTVERAIRLPIGQSQPAQYVTEHPVLLRSGDANIFGIVTEPRTDDLRRRAVLLLNVGAEHHIGSSRMYVTLARRWAQHGYTVFRLDLAGIGDSDTRPNRPEIEVFPPDALEDIRCTVDYIRERYGAREITLSGLCSGAYHSLQAAIVGLPINRLLLVNPMNFLWSAGMSADALQQSVDVSRNLEFLRQRVFSTSIWRRILTGQISIWRIIRIVLQRPVLAVVSTLRDAARAIGIRLPRDLGSHLESLCARGIRLAFVFSRGEPGLDVLKLQAGSTVSKLGDRCRVYIVDSGDHIFSHRKPRSLLENILSEQLYAATPQHVQPKTTGSTP